MNHSLSVSMWYAIHYPTLWPPPKGVRECSTDHADPQNPLCYTFSLIFISYVGSMTSFKVLICKAELCPLRAGLHFAGIFIITNSVESNSWLVWFPI